MRYIGILFSLLLFSYPAFAADMSQEERCVKQGEVAEKATDMRISGVDKDTATRTLIEMYDQPGSGVAPKLSFTKLPGACEKRPRKLPARLTFRPSSN